MDIDLRLARHFVVLAEERHFGRAARRLHLTQPALSKQVQTLERHVGTALVDRSVRPWQLTPAGREVLDLSRDLLERVAAGRRAARSGRRLLIGLLGGEGAGWPVADLLLAAQHAATGHTVGCRTVAFADITRALIDGEVDLLMARPAPDDDRIVSRVVLHEQRLLALPRRWAEADASTLSVAVAGHLPALYNPALPAASFGCWALGDVRPLREARLVPSLAQSMADLVPEIARGAVVTVAGSTAATLRCLPVRLVPLADAPPVASAVCWRADDRREPLARAVTAVADALTRARGSATPG